MNDKSEEIAPKTPEEEGEIIELDGTIPEEVENPDEIVIEDEESDEEAETEPAREIICKISFSSKDNYKSFKDVLKKCIGNTIDADFQESEESNELTVLKVPELSFLIDATPVADKVKIPSYKRCWKDVYNGLDETPAPENDAALNKANNPNVCFNCSSADHSIKDCPEEKDIDRIRKAKKLMMSKKDFHKLTRYHVDANQAYADLQPGKISSELSKALGLKKKELPSFFFRMRLFGYPEGWLKAAEIQDSGITMITGNGETKSTGDDSIRYDESKIISYPGFNECPGKDYHDDFKYFNVPKWEKKFSRETFIENLGEKVVQSTNVPKRAKMEFPVNHEDHENIEEASEAETTVKEEGEQNDEENPASPSPTTDNNEELPQTPASNKASISIDFGTPLLKFSPYDNLPPGSNFQVGVSDVINFENLPDSTGTYEKMEKIIKKVRTEVKKLNS
ncbi:ZCCHC8 family protein [Megaselia abdita]